MNNMQYSHAIQQSQIQNLQTQNMIMMAQNSHQSGGRMEQPPIWPVVLMVLVGCIFLAATVWWSDRQERKNG
jgi:hypothetical protein